MLKTIDVKAIKTCTKTGEEECRCTYSWEFGATITALHWAALFRNMEIAKFATRCLDDANIVRLGVVSEFVRSVWENYDILQVRLTNAFGAVLVY